GRLPQRLRTDPRLVPRRGRSLRGEVAGGRSARAAALGRVRHGQQRRARERGRQDRLTRLGISVAASRRPPARPGGEHAMNSALRLVTDQTGRSMPIAKYADAMSALASGVVLVTCRVGGRPWGMTVTAFASASADPPTVLVSLGSETASSTAIRETGRFGVSILGDDQLDVARFGSVPGAAKFLE